MDTGININDNNTFAQTEATDKEISLRQRLFMWYLVRLSIEKKDFSVNVDEVDQSKALAIVSEVSRLWSFGVKARNYYRQFKLEMESFDLPCARLLKTKSLPELTDKDDQD